MPTGYTRQSAAQIVTGNTINASDFNNEYNLLATFADGTNGHDHSGGSGLGPKLSLTAAVSGILPAANGGTGVANSNTITLGGNVVTTSTVSITGALSTAAAFSTSGANSLVLTTTAPTNVTLPTSGTLVNSAVTTLSSLVSIGTITTGAWNGTVITGTYGGTGVNNGVNTITLGGLLSTAGTFATFGAFPLSLTTTGATALTLPTSGTLVNSAVATLSSLTSVGTIGTGVWQGTVVGSTYGGTGVNNGSSTITLGGNLVTSGAFACTFTLTNTTSVTLPTSGTLVNTAVTSLSSLATVGTITSGIWNAGAVTSTGAVTGTTHIPTGSTAPTDGLFLPSANNSAIAGQSQKIVQFAGNTATTPNFFVFNNSGTGGTPTLQLSGGDTNINFNIITKGVGGIGLQTNGSVTQAAITHTASAVNWVNLTGSATTTAVIVSSAGSDTDIDLAISPKGAGLVKLGNSTSFAANASVATVLGSVGPAGSHTTVQKWLAVKDNSGTTLYIPCF